VIRRQTHQTVQYNEEHQRMNYKPKRRRAPVVRDTRDQRVHEAKRHRIGDKEKGKSGVQRILELQTCRLDRHLV
jgi:hypothetical protein